MIWKNTYRYSLFNILCFTSCYLLSSVRGAYEIPKCSKNTLCAKVECRKNLKFDVTNYCLYNNYIIGYNDDYSSGCVNYYSLERGFNIVKLEGGEITPYTSVQEFNPTDVLHVALINCESDSNCVQTTGIIRNNNLEYYNIYDKKDKINSKINISKYTCTSNVGGLALISNQVVLCLSWNSYVPLSSYAGYYLIEDDVASDSPFIVDKTNKNAVIRVDNESFVFSNYFSGSSHFYLNSSNGRLYNNLRSIISNSIYGSMAKKIYYCDSGSCTTYDIDITEGIYMIYDKLYSVSIKDGNIVFESVKKNGIMAFKSYLNGNIPDISKVLVEDSQLMGDLLKEVSNISLYDCIMGECSRTSGYLKVTSKDDEDKPLVKVYKCSKDSCNTEQSSVSCEKKNVGIAVYDSGKSEYKICINSGTTSDVFITKVITSGTSLNHYFSYIGSNYYNLYISDKTGSIVGLSVNGGFFAREKESGNTEENTPKKYDLMVCSGDSKKEDASICFVSNTITGYLLNSGDKDSSSLIYCDKTNCSIEKKDGYFINSLNQYIIKCESSYCYISDEGSSCENNNNEAILYYDRKLETLKYGYCNGSQEVKFLDTDQYYPLSNINASSHYPIINSGRDTILIKIDKYSATQYINEKVVCITSSNTLDPNCKLSGSKIYKCQTTDTSCTVTNNICDPQNKTGGCSGYYLHNSDLYECVNDISKNETPIECTIKPRTIKGYFKITDIFAIKDSPYLFCDGNECKNISAPTDTVTKCNNIGKLVLNSSKVKLCINSSSMVGFSETNEYTSYLIEDNENEKLSYPGSNYTLITIAKDSMISYDLANIESGTYIFDSETYKIDKNTENEFTIEKVKTPRISVFRFENNNGYGKLVNEEDDLSKIDNEIRLYDCQNGHCIRTTGYIKLSNNEIHECTLNNCKNKQEKVSCTFKSCDKVENCNNDYMYGNVGIAYYDNDFKICFLENSRSFKPISIKASHSLSYNLNFKVKSDLSDMTCTSSLPIYNLYISNKLGNIVMLSVQDGYYLFEEKTRLLKCIGNQYGSECYRSSNPGYYINSGSEKSNDLIYCNGSICVTKPQDNGYFVNSEFGVVICGSSECAPYDKGRECNFNSDEVILNTNGLLNYCRDVNEVEFLNVDQYYPLPNINAKTSIYPKDIKKGSDTILLNIGKSYSVTQYISVKNDTAICIDKNNVEDVGCHNPESTKYLCPSSTETCKTERNICNPLESTSSCSGYYLVDVDNTYGNGTLYECTNNVNNAGVTCISQPNTTRGYFKVTDIYEKEIVPYIKCNGTSCKKMNLPTKSVEKCENEDFGELVLDSSTSEVKLCADSYNMIGFSIDGSLSKRIINENYENGVFTDRNDYVFVNINYNSMKPVDDSLIESNTYLFNDETYSFNKEVNKDKTTINIRKLPLSGMMAFMFNDIGLGTLIKDDDYNKDLSKSLMNINLYECKSGFCIATTGYLKYNINRVVECNGNNCNKEQNQVPLSCYYNNSGFAFYSSSQGKFLICLEYYFISYNYYDNFEINEGVQYMYDNNKNELFITDNGGNVIGKTTREGFFLHEHNGYGTLIICNPRYNNGVRSISECSYITYKYGYYINAGSDASNELIYCYNNNCNLTKEDNGYYVNTYQVKNGIKCVESKCSLFKVGISCYKHENSIVYKNSQFIYCDGHNLENMSSSNKYYPLPDVNAVSTYYPQIDSGNNIILVTTDSYSLKQYITNEEGVCLDKYHYKRSCNAGNIRYICTQKRKECKISMVTCDPTAETPDLSCNGYYLVEDEKLNDKTTLYLCDQDEDNNYDVKCIAQPDSIRGYFRVTDSYESLSYQYIKCDGNKCEKLLTKNLNNKCNGAGDLIYDYNYVYLCFSDMNVRFSDFGNKIVNFGTKENIFTDEINVNLVINITTRHIIPTDLSELPTNIYLIGSYIYLFVNKGKGKYSIENLQTTGALAFRCYHEVIYKEINGVLIKNEEYLGPISDDYLSTIKTYHCIKGKCNNSLGFINYDTNKVYRCYSSSSYLVTSRTCDDYNIGNAFFDTTFNLCTRNRVYDSYVYKPRTITSGTSINYIVTLESSYNDERYNLFITDKSGNVVVRNTQSGYYLYDFNGDGNKSLLICNYDTCYKSGYTGYFINTLSEKSNSLIYCKSTDSCEIVTRENGYFTNSEGNAIKCSLSVCSDYYYESTGSCIGHQYEIIKYSGFRFCKGTEIVEFGSTYNPMFYPISVNAGSSVFPKYNNGTDTILLIADKYSLTQKLTDSNGIYVNANYYEDLDGTSTGSTKYICNYTTVGCTVLPNICDPKTSTGGCEGFYLVDNTLYQCKTDCREEKVKCSAKPSTTRGFFKVTDLHHRKDVEYIKCDGSSCTKMEIPGEHKVNDEDYNDEDFDNYIYERYDDYRCSKENISKLINYENDYIAVCLNSRLQYKFKDYTSNSYNRGIISLDSPNNIFAKSSSDKYALLEASNTYVELFDISNVPSNTYLINYVPYAITNNGNGNVVIDKILTTQMMAFKDVNDPVLEELYRVLITEDDYRTDLTEVLNNIRIYDCHFGQCESTYGYLKHNAGNSTNIKISRCDRYCGGRITNVKISQCNSYGGSEVIGKAYYNEETSKFMICVKANSDKYKEKTINSDKLKANYIFNYRGYDGSSSSIYSLYYNLYTSDYGGNIIGESVMKGNYLSKVFEDNISMIRCTPYNSEVKCKRTYNNNGYYLNHGTLGSNLIYCEDGNCNTLPNGNGFFMNDYSEINECSSSQCQPFEPNNVQSCKYNTNEIILSNDEYKYCNQETQIQFKSEIQYYPLSNISTNPGKYPENIISGGDTILIKVDRYSASQYITSGICVNNANTQDYTCKLSTTTPTLYICRNETASCIYGQPSDDVHVDGNSIPDSSLFKDKDNSALPKNKVNMFTFAIKTFIITTILALMFI